MDDISKKTSHPPDGLPVLPQVRINTPCSMNWDEMAGDASKRFCGHCQKHVHNFSEMDAGSVSELLGSGQSICAKIRKRTDGSIVTKESASCDDRISRRGWFSRLGTLAASIAAILTLGGCREPEQIETTGIVAAPPPAAQAPELLGEVDNMGGAELGDVVVVEPQLAAPAAPVQNGKVDVLGRVGPVNPETK